MAIRKILFAIAVLMLLIGVSQLVYTNWWLDRARQIVDSSHFYLWGMPGILFAVVVLIAVLEKAVGLRLLLVLLSLVTLAASSVLLVDPSLMSDFACNLVFNRPHGFQVAVDVISGLSRIAIGLALLVALARPNGSAVPRSRELPTDAAGTVGPPESY